MLWVNLIAKVGENVLEHKFRMPGINDTGDPLIIYGNRFSNRQYLKNTYFKKKMSPVCQIMRWWKNVDG